MIYLNDISRDGAEIQVNSNEQPLAPANKLSLEHKSSVKEQDQLISIFFFLFFKKK